MKVIIYSLGEEHDNDVKTSFIRGYQSNGARFTDNIDIMSFVNLDDAMSYATNNNYQYVIYSNYGLSSLTGIINNYYPNVICFIPAGNNSHIKVFNQSILDNNISAVVTGCVDVTQNNVTGYNVEFIDIDPVSSNHLSSYSNGYIAGKMAYIKDWYNCTDWEARNIARQTASRSNNFTDENGFGIINLNAAINTFINIPKDEIINLSDIGNMLVTRDKNQININVDAIENATKYKIYRNDELIYNGSNNIFTDTITPTGEFNYKYKAYNSKEETSFSTPQKIVYRPYESILFR